LSGLGRAKRLFQEVPAGDAAMRSTYFNLFGYHLRLSGELSPKQRRALFGRQSSTRAAAADLQIEFVKRLPSSVSEQVLSFRGKNFVAFPRERRMLYRIARKSRNTAAVREDWVRSASYALCVQFECGSMRRSGHFLLYLHASCVAGRNGALAFCGYSTFGKSTIASRLLSSYPLVDDDLIVLLCPRACGARELPRIVHFARYVREGFGAAPAPNQVRWLLPVASLVWLKKGANFELEPLAISAAAAALLSPVTLRHLSAATMRRLQLIGVLLKMIPCQQLEFRKERAPLVTLLRERGLL